MFPDNALLRKTYALVYQFLFYYFVIISTTSLKFGRVNKFVQRKS
jgi:hypothetical protein